MASTTYSTYPTQRNFIDQPTGSGGSTTIEYVGYAGATSPIVYRTSGTGTWTFVLPPPSQYTLLPGTRFEFMNNSTGLVTVNASDNSLVTTVASGASVPVTQVGLGATNASWVLTTPNTISGILPIANGGTGQSTLVTTPTANTIPAWDAASSLRAKNFLGDVLLNPASQTFTGITLPTTVVVTTGAGFVFVLPLESSVTVGRSVTFENRTANYFLVNDFQGDSHFVVPYMGVTYTNTNAGGGNSSWIASTFWVSQFGLPLIQPAQSACQTLICTGAGQTATMSSQSLRNTLVYGTGAGVNAVYNIILPDVTDMLPGTSYTFFTPYSIAAIALPTVRIKSSDGTLLITIGAVDNISLATNRCVCTSVFNSGAGHIPWNVTYGTNS
jgi:hypothetical protein